jgi:glycosyltransferase involved in cell wall biosynthesis
MHIVIASNFPGDARLGSAKIPLREADALRTLGHRVTLVFQESLEAVGAGRVADLTAPFRFASVLEQISDADVVDIAGFDGFPFFSMQRRRKRRPALVCRLNGLWREVLRVDWSNSPSSLSKRCLRALYQESGPLAFEATSMRSADVVRTLSAADRTSLERGKRKGERPPIVAIAPGIDSVFLRSARGAFSERTGIAFVGNWIPRKGTRALAEAMTEALSDHPSLEFFALGTGLAEEHVKGQFPRSTHARIHVQPRIEAAALAQVLATVGIFVFPTLYEGYGLVVAEAMASGCAVITTPTGAGAELIRHEQNGLLVEPDDSRGLAQSISRLLGSTEESERLASQASQTVAGLTWLETARRLENLYLTASRRKQGT